MSLLLDARKKLQQAHSAQGEEHALQTTELSLEELPDLMAKESSDARPTENARSAGQNLFVAKSPFLASGRILPNRNLLFALGGTILLLAIGAGYFVYLDSSSNTAPLRPAGASPAAPLAQVPPPAVGEPAAPQGALVPGIAEADSAGATRQARGVIQAPVASAPRPASASPVRVEQRISEPLVDPLLNDAYLAYRDGKLEEAQQLYLAMFRKDAGNTDALLGLASIAQQRGEDRTAAQYYARVLAQDPRNALANAGMSALSADSDNNESRLKILLREQGNSAALHFALGNLYAGQTRWGEAQQAYFSAYTLESGNAEFAFNLAVSLDHLGQSKLAAQHYQRAIQLDLSHIAGFDHAQISQRVQELTR
jgi:hypothetical protein